VAEEADVVGCGVPAPPTAKTSKTKESISAANTFANIHAHTQVITTCALASTRIRLCFVMPLVHCAVAQQTRLTNLYNNGQMLNLFVRFID
jgi:hypothetical protein